MPPIDQQAFKRDARNLIIQNNVTGLNSLVKKCGNFKVCGYLNQVLQEITWSPFILPCPILISGLYFICLPGMYTINKIYYYISSTYLYSLITKSHTWII